MEFGLTKCDVLIMKKGEIATFGGIILTEKDSLEVQGWHSQLVCGLGARGPEFDSQIWHPCFDSFLSL